MPPQGEPLPTEWALKPAVIPKTSTSSWALPSMQPQQPLWATSHGMPQRGPTCTRTLPPQWPLVVPLTLIAAPRTPPPMSPAAALPTSESSQGWTTLDRPNALAICSSSMRGGSYRVASLHMRTPLRESSLHILHPRPWSMVTHPPEINSRVATRPKTWTQLGTVTSFIRTKGPCPRRDLRLGPCMGLYPQEGSRSLTSWRG